MDIQQLQNVTDKIVEQFQPDKVVLFGSQAWGIPTADSDVDLLIIKDTVNTRQLAQQVDGAIFPRPFPLDVMVYTAKQIQHRLQQGDLFMQKIVQHGKTLYAR